LKRHESVVVILSALALVGALVTEGAQPSNGGQAPESSLYLVPNELFARMGPEAVAIHQYAGSLLATVPAPELLSPADRSRLTSVRDPRVLMYRGWRGAASGVAPRDLEGLPDAYYLVAFAGPIDPAWKARTESLGLEIVGPASPYALLIRGGGPALSRLSGLTTSFGFDAVRAVVPVPLEARLDETLARLARGQAAPSDVSGVKRDRNGLALVRVDAYPGASIATVKSRVRRLAESTSETSSADAGVFAVRGPEILDVLEGIPEVSYVEAVHQRVLHDDLAPKSYILNVEPVWTGAALGYDGTGVIVDHNDSGVDLTHPDFPASAIAATAGTMSGTDNGHGTHTAGSVLGRGLASPSPTNTFGCGDRTTPLPAVRGMAFGARLVTNNIFDGGFTTETSMLRWGSQQGARISTNSWGYVSLHTYSSQAATVDSLVRDADSTTTGNQELLVFFSAGNDGPGAGTVDSPGTAKNVVTVGASQNDRCGAFVSSSPDVNAIASFSSRGPSQGRIKPDLVAVGTDVLSAQSSDPLATAPWDQSWTGGDYSTDTGTSMSTPLSAGAGAVFFQFYKARFGSFPSPALAKAALINGAVDMGFGFPSFQQGWGRLNLRRSIEGPPGGAIHFFDETDVTPLSTGASWSKDLVVASSGVPLKVSLVWTDPAAAGGSTSPLVNDLDLVLTAPSGTIYRGNFFTGSWSTPNPGTSTDTANNVENIFVQAPAPGRWTVRVSSALTAINPRGVSGQDFALVYSGDASECVPPAAPSSLVATSPGANRIDLAWSASPGATSYEILRATSSGGPYGSLTSVAATSYTDLAVSAGTTYYYVVTASGIGGCASPLSREASAIATGDCTLPPTFAGLSAARASGTTCAVDLSWAAATSNCLGASLSYDVYRSTVPGFTPGPTNLLDTCITGEAYQDTLVSSGTTYFYAVRAEDGTSSGGGPCNGGNTDKSLVEISTAVAGTCIAPPDPLPFFTVTSTDARNELEWLNPASGGSVVIVVRTDHFPAGVGDGTTILAPVGTPDAHQSLVHEPLVNGTTYYYGAFVRNAGGDVSFPRFTSGRPQSPSGNVRWVYQTSAAAVAPPAIGSVYAVSNDAVLHSMVPGPGGGTWPSSWVPLAMNQPAQSRPPVVLTALGGANKVLFVGTQDGIVHAVDAVRGSTIWTSPVLGERIQAAPAGIFTAFGGAYDLVFAATRNSVADNAIVALRLSDGHVAWRFDNGGGSTAIGIVSGSASVDYALRRLYFASRSPAGGSAGTLWCIEFTDLGASLVWARAIGDVDGSPIVFGGKVYVGTNQSKVYAIDAATGVDLWTAPFDAGDGPVKGFVWPGFGTGELFFATTTTLHALTDGGTSAVEKWRITSIPSPSTPLFVPGSRYLLVGGGDGRLYQLNLATTTPVSTSEILGAGTAAVGAPSLDLANHLIYVGTTQGAIYAVNFPLR
jgi:subtilisin family serine protease/outer membrane protein assembly factor BamB